MKISAHDLIVPGQDTIKSNNSNMWLNFGVGVLPENKRMDSSPGLGVNFSFQSKIHLISCKLFYAKELPTREGPLDRLTSLDLMYGLIYKKPEWYCSLSTGINYSWLSDYVFTGPYNGDGYTVHRNKIGLPIDLQLFKTGREFGIGINYFVIFNNNYIFCGGLICLQYGKLR